MVEAVVFQISILLKAPFTLKVTIKFSLVRCLLGIILLVSSCGSKQAALPVSKAQPTEKSLHSPAVDYPSVEYDEVALYSVDATHYKDEYLVPLDGNQTKEETLGFAILDSLGNPAFKNIDRTTLSPVEMKEMQSIFHIPENKGEIEKMMCIASFRDAFVFYRNKKQVAQAQICFGCKQVYFSLDTTNLADRFATDGDWDSLQNFISKVKVQ